MDCRVDRRVAAGGLDAVSGGTAKLLRRFVTLRATPPSPPAPPILVRFETEGEGAGMEETPPWGMTPSV